MFFCEYCEILKSTYFEEHLWAAVFELSNNLQVTARKIPNSIYMQETVNPLVPVVDTRY